jgi:hypothetical protein
MVRGALLLLVRADQGKLTMKKYCCWLMIPYTCHNKPSCSSRLVVPSKESTVKRKLGSIAALAALGAATLSQAGVANAQTAYQTTFQTSITYQNVDTSSDTAAANVVFNFYPEGNGTPIPITRTLPKGAAGSLFVGNLSELASFNGSGSVVANSDKPIVATAVQIPASTSPVKNRLLSNGFTQGANRQLIATVLKNRFGSSTKISVQNASGGNVSGTVKFFNADAGGAEVVAARQTVSNLPDGAAKYFDANTIGALPAGFNGSAVIEMSGAVVASAMELSTTGVDASAFESVTDGGNTVYMPSALCNAFGAQRQNSAYAIQNTGTTTANVTVSYTNGSITRTQNLTVAAGAKASSLACQAGVGDGFNGSATITSTGGQIVAIAKIYGPTNSGLYTASVGATSGAARLALPYVRWSATRYDQNQRDRQRAFIAIQNVGAPLAAGTVRVRYIDVNGTTVGTHTISTAIATGGKVNSNASLIGAAGSEFGYSGSQFGGSAIIEGPAGSQLTAVVRVASVSGSSVVGEDYNGIPIQ